MKENFIEPQLTRKEVKFIRLFRLQSEECQEEIVRKVEEAFADWKENERSRLLDSDDTDCED